MNKLLRMLSNFFSKSEFDLDGYHFKNEYRKDKNNVLPDVRTGKEHDSGSLPSALHWDFLSSSLSSSAAALPKDKAYSVFCRSGNRSSSAVSMMRKMGYNA